MPYRVQALDGLPSQAVKYKGPNRVKGRLYPRYPYLIKGELNFSDSIFCVTFEIANKKD
jgi:hypothetical protein